MDKDKAMKVFDLITSLKELEKVSEIISTELTTDEPKLSIVSFTQEGPLTIENTKILKDIQRGIDYRIFEIRKKLHEL